ncbi:sensor histidine kinase [Streptomyces gilvosporeus]|uniref:histidine kinase n=1 Tax=Streptomyces gilvosporeus TaxID=553510 RepID=A0A1V0U3P8_9ACTN|nr:histidine kinase [Streptomyces gilvosporeus]ARF59628.1 two-component sensor histidine kinase [Streptomyces gilvosporeus]
MWTPGRIVGETLLSLVLGLLAAASETLEGSAMSDAGIVRGVAVGLAAALLSLLRRVLPATVLLVTAAGMAEFEGLSLLVVVAAWSAGRRIEEIGKAAGTFAAAYAVSLGLSLLAGAFSLVTALAVAVPMLLVMIVVPGLVSRYWWQRRTLTDTLREYNAQLLRERAMVAGQARMRERQRIAQDMHDSLGHQLTLISVHTGALEVDRELTGRQREAVGVLREASVAAMHELREVVGLLRDGTENPGQGSAAHGVRATGEEDATVPSRGVAGVESLVAASRSVGTAVELRRSGEPRPLTPTADHAAYRVAQEGLTNAHKHAQGASITIELRYEPDALVVEVANGPVPETTAAGRSVVSGGQGLTGLGERTRLIGGMVHAGPTADGGFRLAGVLPYASPDGGAPSLARGDGGTTFVGPTGDLREQFAAGSAEEGVPVIDGNGLPKELARAMSRNTRRSGIAIGCGIAALILVLLVVLGIVAVIFLAGESEKAMIEPKQYDAVQLGRSEAEVRAKLPLGNSFLARGLDKGAPPAPKGAQCLTLLSSENGSSQGKQPVFRFCFRDGRLIEKKSFEMRS